jgi:DNA-binding LacI/PurR family transcriptional regulator
VTWERPIIDGILPFETEVPDFLPYLHPMYEKPEPPTAIICPGDWMAIATIAALNKLGLKVPDDVSVTGVGIQTFAKAANPQLTSLDDRLQTVAEKSTRLLLDLIDGKESEDVTLLVRMEMIIRESTAPPKKLKSDFMAS